eukprot:15065255-Alexandrium_andersonii.AAC.1
MSKAAVREQKAASREARPARRLFCPVIQQEACSAHEFQCHLAPCDGMLSISPRCCRSRQMIHGSC